MTTSFASDSTPPRPWWYAGNCHCGLIRFTLRYPCDLTDPRGSPYQACICDCSLCARLGWILCYPQRQDVWLRVAGSGAAPRPEESGELAEGWAHPRDEERGTGYRVGRDVFGSESGSSSSSGQAQAQAQAHGHQESDQPMVEGKQQRQQQQRQLPLLTYTHAARECDVVFCGVCGSSLFMDTRPGFEDQAQDGDGDGDGDVVSVNVRLFQEDSDFDIDQVVTRKGRGKSFPPDYVPQFEP